VQVLEGDDRGCVGAELAEQREQLQCPPEGVTGV
jgi:hypothetical protein